MYKTINGWTKKAMKQQIRLKNNGTKSLRKNGFACAYRGTNNNACAVGCFIPDEFYRREVEGKTPRINSFSTIFDITPELLMLLPLEPDGLTVIQRIHDAHEEEKDIRDVLCDWIDKNVVDGD